MAWLVTHTTTTTHRPVTHRSCHNYDNMGYRLQQTQLHVYLVFGLRKVTHTYHLHAHTATTRSSILQGPWLWTIGASGCIARHNLLPAQILVKAT